MISVREATAADISLLNSLYHGVGKRDDGYFDLAFEKKLIVLIANFDDTPCGFCLLNIYPRYNLYKKLNIPEIQDLNVMKVFRRQGIATTLIKYCEGMARAKGADYIGISVGLTKDYGTAQILYAKMGYIPDGNGVTYDREPVITGKSYPMDDDMALMLVKPL